jgi:hydrogenase 3 maturation protease
MSEDLNKLMLQKYKKKLFVGIGNLLKTDDGAGVYIITRIVQKDDILSLTAEVSIENYIGKINSMNPDILVLIDCVDMKEAAGTFKLLSLRQIRNMTFNTHNISLRHLADFFMMPVFVLAIQPLTIDFGENLSYLVKNVADRIIRQINKKEVYHGCRIHL